MKEFQPRYIAYALAHGHTPEAQLTIDKQDWPGGCMAGFMVWIQEQWHKWDVETNWQHVIRTQSDHDAFNIWLRV